MKNFLAVFKMPNVPKHSILCSKQCGTPKILRGLLKPKLMSDFKIIPLIIQRIQVIQKILKTKIIKNILFTQNIQVT